MSQRGFRTKIFAKPQGQLRNPALRQAGPMHVGPAFKGLACLVLWWFAVKRLRNITHRGLAAKLLSLGAQPAKTPLGNNFRKQPQLFVSSKSDKETSIPVWDRLFTSIH